MPPIRQQTPPLVAGDRLTRDEFLRRWEAMPGLKKAELIGGIVYMAPLVGAEHGETDAGVTHWVQHYAIHTPGCNAGSNTTWYMLQDAPQPDAHLRLVRDCGGASWVEKGILHGAPELVAETTRSSTSYDLHQKKDLYEAAGVKEYVVVLLDDEEVLWHRLVGSKYQTLEVTPEGLLYSVVFPGLWLDPSALLRADMAKVLQVLEEGLNSPEHDAFARDLERKLPQ